MICTGIRLSQCNDVPQRCDVLCDCPLISASDPLPRETRCTGITLPQQSDAMQCLLTWKQSQTHVLTTDFHPHKFCVVSGSIGGSVALTSGEG